MANIKASLKSIRQDEKQTKINKSRNTALKTEIKKTKVNKDSKNLAKVYKTADSIGSKGQFSKNKVNRIKSRNAKALNKKA